MSDDEAKVRRRRRHERIHMHDDAKVGRGQLHELIHMHDDAGGSGGENPVAEVINDISDNEVCASCGEQVDEQEDEQKNEDEVSMIVRHRFEMSIGANQAIVMLGAGSSIVMLFVVLAWVIKNWDKACQ